MKLTLLETQFVAAFNILSEQVYLNARDKGWWDESRNDGELICLIHLELSEALKGLRHGNPASNHISKFSAVEEEFADVIIRIMDVAKARKWKVAEAIIKKIAFNKTRPHKHGGKKF